MAAVRQPGDDGMSALRSRISRSAMRRWLPLIVLATLLAGIGGLVWAGSSDPTYTASATIELTDDASGNTTRFVDRREMRAQQQLLLSNAVRGELESALGLSAPALGEITVATSDETTLLSINVTSTESATALRAADALIDIYTQMRLTTQVEGFEEELTEANARVLEQQGVVSDITSQLSATEDASERRSLEINQQNAIDRLQVLEARAQELVSEIALADGRIVVLDRPIDASINQRSQWFTVALFAVLGALLSGGVVVAIAAVNPRVRLVEEIEALIPPEVPVLASVPKFRRQYRGGQSSIVVGNHAAMREAEAFRLLRTTIELAGSEQPTMSLAVTSAAPGEGKTTTAANLALALAWGHSRTLLVDADLLSSSLPALSGRSASQNTLRHLIAGTHRVEELVTSIGSDDRQLDMLIAEGVGDAAVERVELVPEVIRQVLKDLSDSYQVVVVDTPPALVVADAVAISAAVDATIVVVRLGRTRRRDVSRTLETLQQNGANVLGVVATFADAGSGYGYGYGYAVDDSGSAAAESDVASDEAD